MPRTDSSSLEASDLRAIRARPKLVRFCPSCGYQAPEGRAAHWRCGTCGYAFFCSDASSIRGLSFSEVVGTSARFNANVSIEAPIERPGVARLISPAAGADPEEVPYAVDEQDRHFSDI